MLLASKCDVSSVNRQFSLMFTGWLEAIGSAKSRLVANANVIAKNTQITPQ